MTYFDPTPSEMLFRLCVSLAGLFLMGFAVALRGMPGEDLYALLGGAALVFFAFSAGVSGVKLRGFRGV